MQNEEENTGKKTSTMKSKTSENYDTIQSAQ